jgi:hypothetical protein
MHDVIPSDDTLDEEPVDIEEPPPAEDPLDTRLINAIKSSAKHISPGYIRRFMSNLSKCQANIAQIHYYVSYHKATKVNVLSLIDHGANGGVSGEDVRVLSR